MLWFHEYDDLDVEVGELASVKWDIKGEKVEIKVEIKVEDKYE